MSKKEFDLVTTLKEIVNSTGHSYNVYETIAKNCSKEDLYLLNNVFVDLKDSQELIAKYLMTLLMMKVISIIDIKKDLMMNV